MPRAGRAVIRATPRGFPAIIPGRPLPIRPRRSATSTDATDLTQFPYRRTWSDTDPARHPFAWDEAEEAELVALLEDLVRVTAAYTDPPGQTSSGPQWRFVHRATDLLVERYGRWAHGWDWAAGVGGGVVTGWCCTAHSVGEPERTARAAVASLLEWRAWLEELAERFEELAPPPGIGAEDRSWYLERAVVRLVTVVVDRTAAEAGWHGLCGRVLEWYLASAGVDEIEAEAMARDAVDDRFRSWVTPSRTTVDALAEQLAVRVTGEPPYRDR